MPHGTEEWCKIWRKIEYLPKIFSKFSRLGLWWDPFTKVENGWAENLQRSYVSWQWRMMQNLKRNWLVISKLRPDFDKTWIEHSNVSKICTFMRSFWPRYIIFELKKYMEVVFVGTEDWCKIWRKTNLCFPKWHDKFGKLSQAENSDFILENKMVELYQNKNSKQPDLPDRIYQMHWNKMEMSE